jgi:propionaldehyde dehydrogenase
MMPVLPIVQVKDFEAAVALAVSVEHGNRHTAVIHSRNVENLTSYARAAETTIFVKNAPSYAGIGFGGEGFTTFTIAGPTGEGITSARTFTRQRRCVLVDAFSIV